MPVEIRELIIKAVVTSDCTGNDDSGTNGGCTDEKEILIAECIEKILEILKDKEER
ncbi:DUF5908 family protein [Draconibacterium sp.]|nr:DUF5908 family protein [Draconibacterium sp.]